MNIICPHCYQTLGCNESLAGTSVECPACGKTIAIPESQHSTSPHLPDNESGDDGTLDAANRFLERLIGNVTHAIIGIFRRVITVLQWFFSAKFAWFILLLLVLAALLVAMGGIMVAPYTAILWFCKAPPKEIPDYTYFATPPEWQWLFKPKESLLTLAIIVEIVWMAFFVAWGIWIGIKSYKRGAFSRWRERRRAHRAARA